MDGKRRDVPVSKLGVCGWGLSRVLVGAAVLAKGLELPVSQGSGAVPGAASAAVQAGPFAAECIKGFRFAALLQHA